MKYTNNRADGTADVSMLREPQQVDVLKKFFRERYPYNKDQPVAVRVTVEAIQGLKGKSSIYHEAAHIVAMKVLGGAQACLPVVSIPLAFKFPSETVYPYMGTPCMALPMPVLDGQMWTQMSTGTFGSPGMGGPMKGYPPFDVQTSICENANGDRVP